MRILIVNEQGEAASLKERLQELNLVDSIYVAATAEQTKSFLEATPCIDVLLSDVRIGQTFVFSIIKDTGFQGCVIFMTEPETYIMTAFEILGVNYLLKPVTAKAIAEKLSEINMSGTGAGKPLGVGSLADAMPFRKRFVGRVGNRHFFLDTKDIAYFEADNKIVQVAMKDGNRYLVDHTMERLEKELLDPGMFFRLNRSVIVNIDAIEQVRPHANSRLKLSIKSPGTRSEVIVSRDKVASFRSWSDV